MVAAENLGPKINVAVNLLESAIVSVYGGGYSVLEDGGHMHLVNMIMQPTYGDYIIIDSLLDFPDKVDRLFKRMHKDLKQKDEKNGDSCILYGAGTRQLSLKIINETFLEPSHAYHVLEIIPSEKTVIVQSVKQKSKEIVSIHSLSWSNFLKYFDTIYVNFITKYFKKFETFGFISPFACIENFKILKTDSFFLTFEDKSLNENVLVRIVLTQKNLNQKLIPISIGLCEHISLNELSPLPPFNFSKNQTIVREFIFCPEKHFDNKLVISPLTMKKFDTCYFRLEVFCQDYQPLLIDCEF
eukprot:TRINITY_DN9875_c0_g1_i1.p1 TRINITY_DN9875_c0_g1~~TRINITY_DN9875_c0_g1_i1.p1  ORF type:complete len:299 (+),score=70.47 TRINITY_DN9875_c0_g1_i1:377-1273(+)